MLQINGSVNTTNTGFIVNNSGNLQVNGTINAGTGLTVNSGGTLSGFGTISAGNTTIQGTLEPGITAGILNTSNLTFAGTPSFNVGIGGTTAGNAPNFHDQANVTGSVNLGTSTILNLTAINGFIPSVGDQFVLINNDGADAIAGTFAGLVEGTIINNFWDPHSRQPSAIVARRADRKRCCDHGSVGKDKYDIQRCQRQPCH